MAYYEQPGRTTSTDKDGKQSTTIVYVGTEEAPQPVGLSGTVKSKSVTKSEAGQIRTQYQIELDSAGQAPTAGPLSGGTSYEYISTVRTVPIEAHPNFGGSQISRGGFIKPEDIKLIKDTVQTPGKTFEDITDQLISGQTSKCRSLYGYLAAGIESYYVPSMVVRKTYQASSPPAKNSIPRWHCFRHASWSNISAYQCISQRNDRILHHHRRVRNERARRLGYVSLRPLIL